MSLFASLSGVRVVTLSLTIPLYGMWSADVALAGTQAVPELVTLAVGNLSMHGAVYRQVVFAGQRTLRLVAGFGGWRKPVRRQQYQLESGVRLSTVIGDAANAVGERVVVDVDRVLGRDWTRRAGPASDELRRVAGATWRIDSAGTTRLDAWPVRPVRSQFNVVDQDGGRGVVEVATEDYAAWLPGATFSNAVVAPAQKNAGVTLSIEKDGRARLTVMTVVA